MVNVGLTGALRGQTSCSDLDHVPGFHDLQDIILISDQQGQ
jgi:hypothetical protein